jgi:hypothetical protein
MKFSMLLALPFALCLGFTTANAADKEEKVEIKKSDDGKEFKMKVKKKDKDYVGTYENRDYILRGDAVNTVTKEGDYVLYGTPSSDNRYFETRTIKPYVVTRETRVEEPVDVKVEEKVKIKD